MGVQNLWELLAPVGRRVSVETLAGKKLAIDASIWMVQFMKAMRDEKGEMVRNAHLLGFFRRICKLLFLRTKPVFVFDGGTPALKRRTVIARRRQRENAQAKIRKTAEKLLLNHLKAMKLKELAKDIENQKQKNDAKGKLKELANDIENQKQKNDAKGKKVLSDQTDMEGNNSKRDDMVSSSYNQEKLDEMLAASLAAEEDGSFASNASTSAAGIPSEEDDGDEDEEMILPTMHGKVDPAVLAALPPSMQLDLLVQMRERLMAENRQKYQKVKKAPEKFSELQIQSYLKTVAFRREIDEVQKSAAGRGVGGVQTSRIASEANREFIFSSSFTGDKQALTSAGAEINRDKQGQQPSECPIGSLDNIASTVKSSTATASITDEPRRALDDDVETYLDERGRVRVSRVRAMGIRMTRDLQRNLDIMKEIEQERTNANKLVNLKAILNENDLAVPNSFSKKNQCLENSHEGNDETNSLSNRNEQSLSKNETSIVISFEDDSEHKCLDDDDVFTRLVAGNPAIISSVGITSSGKQSSDSASDSDWEEGIVENKVGNDVKAEIKPSLVEGSISDESEVEWEEGVSNVIKDVSPCPAEFQKAVSKGILEENAEFQEAIRRSLEDLRGGKSIDASSEKENIKRAGEMAHEGIIVGFINQKNDRADPNVAMENMLQQNESFREIVAGDEKPDSVCGTNASQIIDAPGRQLISSIASQSNDLEGVIDKPREKHPGSHPDLLKQDASENGNLNIEMRGTESVSPIETEDINFSAEQLLDISNEAGEVSTLANSCLGNSSCISDSLFGNVPDAILVDAYQNDSEAGSTCFFNKRIDPSVYLGGSAAKAATTNIDVESKLEEKKDRDNFSMDKGRYMDNSDINDNKKVQDEVTEASLEEEMLILDRECINLGEEQRKHERNAESVSSEMFTECQELLQMFGLPYIIAPMEAEAQCAYMELANLVDGVVTDDSDVFLFGARSVYKNIFDDRKYVETYYMKDIESELGLTREKLIRMALLLGSDYTEGVSGIGIVNAIEVVNAFPEEDGLHNFREWIESPDPAILGKFEEKTGPSLRKRGSKVGDNDVSCSKSNIKGVSASGQNVSEVHEHEQSVDYIQGVKQSFMDKHRNVSKNWHIPSSFPSEAVISAYASPQVDKSTEPFSWGKPDLFVLRKLCWEKFGWTSQKAEELLLPVLKEYNKHETQLRLEAFYTFNERFAKIRSKRIQKAVKGITGNRSLELMDDAVQEVSKSQKKRKESPSEPESEQLLNGIENTFTGNESNSMKKPPPKQSRKRKIHEKAVPPQVENPEPHLQAVGRRSTNKGSSGNRRGRGRGRGQQVTRGRRKGSPGFIFTESSSSDGNGSGNEQEVCAEKLEESHELRRSTRSRRPVNYTVNDFEIDDVGKSLDKDDEECKSLDQSDEEYTKKNRVKEPSWSQGICGDASGGLIDNDHHKSGDPSPEEGLCKDDQKAGGGFCMDEDEIGQLSVSKNGDQFFEAEFSEDYLKMGGGFYSDEGETGKDTGECAHNPTSATVCENAEPSHCSGSIYETEHGVHPVQSLCSPKRASDGLVDTGRNLHRVNATSNDVFNVAASVQDNTKDDTGPTSARALSAMPFLRRKRKKS